MRVQFRSWLLACCLLLPLAARAEPIERVLDELVAEAQEANLEVTGAQAGMAMRLAALDRARAAYLPTIDFNLRYSAADGGRQIDIPVGDLLNPVYRSLNGLLLANGQPAPFRPIDNVSIPLLRPREQQTDVTLTQPLIDARIPATTRAARSDYEASQQGLAALRSRLRRDVQQAYLRWLATRQAQAILASTLEVARENQRVNDSLYRNGKVTRDLVLRAEADVLEVEQQLEASGGAEQTARHYVNLLRDAPLDAELPATAVVDADVARLRDAILREVRGDVANRGRLQDAAVAQRYELKQIDSGLAAADAAADLARAAFKPRLGLAVDAGIQGEQFGFTGNDRFVLASLVLRFNFSNGGADQASLREARARSAQLEAARQLTEQQVRFEVLDALKDFDVAEASLRTAARRVDAAQGAFDIARRKRDLGQIPQVEFIDARRALTSARLTREIDRYDALAALAAVEYAIGDPARASTTVEERP